MLPTELEISEYFRKGCRLGSAEARCALCCFFRTATCLSACCCILWGAAYYGLAHLYPLFFCDFLGCGALPGHQRRVGCSHVASEAHCVGVVAGRPSRDAPSLHVGPNEVQQVAAWDVLCQVDSPKPAEKNVKEQRRHMRSSRPSGVTIWGAWEGHLMKVVKT